MEEEEGEEVPSGYIQRLQGKMSQPNFPMSPFAIPKTKKKGQSIFLPLHYDSRKAANTGADRDRSVSTHTTNTANPSHQAESSSYVTCVR